MSRVGYVLCGCVVVIVFVYLANGGGAPEDLIPPTPPPSSLSPLRSLLFVGDSITFGQNTQGDPYPRPYPSVAGELLAGMGCPATLRVVAVPGGHISPKVPPAPVLSHALWKNVTSDPLGYDAVVFFLAINDAFYHGTPSWTSARQQALLSGLREFTMEFSRRSAKVLWIPTIRFEPMRRSKKTAARKRSLTESVIPTLTQWCATHNWSVLLLSPPLSSSDYYDGVHPTERGHDKLGRAVANALKDMLGC